MYHLNGILVTSNSNLLLTLHNLVQSIFFKVKPNRVVRIPNRSTSHPNKMSLDLAHAQSAYLMRIMWPSTLFVKLLPFITKNPNYLLFSNHIVNKIEISTMIPSIKVQNNSTKMFKFTGSSNILNAHTRLGRYVMFPARLRVRICSELHRNYDKYRRFVTILSFTHVWVRT